MKKYFIVSDIHSFAKSLKDALADAGFRKSNKEHILVVLGDIFDRGFETIEVFKFITSIPKSRRILITGNHELLYMHLLEKQYPEYYDYTNGTVQTFVDIAKHFGYFCDEDNWTEIVKIVRNSPVTKFLQNNEWKPYYELGQYIFTHSYVPNNNNWRNASKKEWLKAMWVCPWEEHLKGYFDEENKTIVCGHWHTSDFFLNLEGKINKEGDIYKSDRLIGIDAGVSIRLDGRMYHRQNVLVIQETDLI